MSDADALQINGHSLVNAAQEDATVLIRDNDVISVTVIDQDGFQQLAGLREPSPSSTPTAASAFKPSASEQARDEAKQRARELSQQAAQAHDSRETSPPDEPSPGKEVADKKWVKSRAHSFVSELMGCAALAALRTAHVPQPLRDRPERTGRAEGAAEAVPRLPGL